MSKLSACMITLDEECILSRALDSIYDFVDEIIIYDTGSKDKTRQIAIGYPKVKFIEGYWDDDYSRARNASIENSTGDWILHIDADEFYDTLNAGCFDKLMEDGDRDGYDAYEFICQAFVGRINPTLYSPEFKVRMFRNYCRFTGRLHETITGFSNKRLVSVIFHHHKKIEWQELDNSRYAKMNEVYNLGVNS